MSGGQLSFDLPVNAGQGRGDIFVSEANREAVEWIDRWPAWPTPLLVLHGPAGCGKSHLLQVWRDKAGALSLDASDLGEALERSHDIIADGRPIVLDDAEQVVDEAAFFHLINSVREAHSSLLLAAGKPPARWPFDLPDLRSRLNAAQIVAIDEPDDVLLLAVLRKLFRDRQVRVAENVYSYLSARMDRSFEAAVKIVARLDEFALAKGRPVSRELARQCLEGMIDP
jgi:chromosomal replication initiation ATPase DnaA